MKGFLTHKVTQIVIIILTLAGNIAFYTLGYPDSGAKSAWEVHPLFFIMCQGLFIYGIVSRIIFLRKGW